jgi:hypothetical protein
MSEWVTDKDALLTLVALRGVLAGDETKELWGYGDRRVDEFFVLREADLDAFYEEYKDGLVWADGNIPNAHELIAWRRP